MNVLPNISLSFFLLIIVVCHSLLSSPNLVLKVKKIPG